MTEEKKSWTSYFTKKVIVSLSVVATILTIVGGIWAFEAHYATNSRVDHVVKMGEEKVVDLELQIAGALQNQQHKSDVRYWQFMYDKLTTDINNLRRQMARYPNDQVLKQDYQDLINQRQEVKEKRDKAMDNIRIN